MSKQFFFAIDLFLSALWKFQQPNGNYIFSQVTRYLIHLGCVEGRNRFQIFFILPSDKFIDIHQTFSNISFN